MEIVKCIRGYDWEDPNDIYEEDEILFLGNHYYITPSGIEDYNGLLLGKESKVFDSWVKEHFVVITKEQIAKDHYHGLIRNTGKSEQSDDYYYLDKMGEEAFVSNYPLSLLEFVNTKRFWQALYEYEIVKNKWYQDEQMDEFEVEIKHALNNRIYAFEHDYDEEEENNRLLLSKIEARMKEMGLK